MPDPGRSPVEIGPYVFPALLAAFGLWCGWDGWFSSDPAMQEHLLFNRIASVILIPWAAFDFRRARQREKARSPAPSTD
jgi:hypothetical protein